MFRKYSIVRHRLTGVLLVVHKSNETVSTCKYLHEKDWIISYPFGVKSVTKIAICLNKNLELSCNCKTYGRKYFTMCSCSDCEYQLNINFI